MTLSSLISSDVASVFLNTDEFAETVTRYIGGDPGYTQSLTSVVTLDQPEFETSRGRGFEIRGTALFDDAATLNQADALLIRGERYEVRTVKPAAFGVIEVTVVRYVPDAKGVRTAGDL